MSRISRLSTELTYAQFHRDALTLSHNRRITKIPTLTLAEQLKLGVVALPFFAYVVAACLQTM